MGEKLVKLMTVAEGPISKEAPRLTDHVRQAAGSLAGELEDMLNRSNGFYLFESALRVLPDRSVGSEYGLAEWNDHDLWIKNYMGAADGMLFFAEDIFGHPFAIKDDAVFSFNPESPKSEYMADTIEGWAAKIIQDYNFLSGWSFAHDWQEAHGPLTPGRRLAPTQPFYLSGEYEIGNFYESDPLEVMRFRAHMWNEVKDLEEGEQVVVLAVDRMPD